MASSQRPGEALRAPGGSIPKDEAEKERPWIVENRQGKKREAQSAPESYNYGYTDATTGAGAEDKLNAANGDFSQFNREQQAQIVMHYYVRKFVSSLDFTAWQPYADLVHA